VSGSAELQENGVQSGPNAIIQWDSFSIESSEAFRFQLPDASSAVLNRVVGGSESQLLGQLLSNGNVYLINPNGVLIGPGAKIVTSGFIASTFDVLDREFLGGELQFAGESRKGIVNLGSVECEKGDIVFIARRVCNEGSLVAPKGTVLLQHEGERGIFIRVGGELQQGARVHGYAVSGEGQDALDVVEVNGRIELSPSSWVEANEIAIYGDEVLLKGELLAGEDLRVESTGLLQVRDSLEAPFRARSGQEFYFAGDTIDIIAFEHPATALVSGGNMCLMSPHPIRSDAHYFARGDFSFSKPDGTAADFYALLDPIISATGSVTFGAYTGVSLKVEATKNITSTGAVTINNPDSGFTCPMGTDPDLSNLTGAKSLILRAGQTDLTTCTGANPVPPDVVAGGATFHQSSAIGTNLITLSGGTYTLTSTSTGVMIFDGAVVLSSDTTVTSNDGDVTFTSTINGSSALSVDAGIGDVTFSGAVGGGTSLVSLAVSGDTISVGADQTVDTGPMTYNGDVTITANTTFTDNGASSMMFQNGITGAGLALTINAPDTGVSIDGSIDINGASDQAGGTLSITAGTDVTIAGSINTFGGNSTFADGSIGGDVTIISTGGSVIVANIDASGGNGFSVGNTNGGDGGSISLQPATTFTTGSLGSIPNGTVQLFGTIIKTTGGTAHGTGTAGVGGSIDFAPTTRSAPMSVATIYGSFGSENSVNIQGGSFSMGSNEAMTIYGGLNVVVTGIAQFSDVVALDTISISATAISLNDRPAVTLLGSAGNLYISPTPHILARSEPSLSVAITPSDAHVGTTEVSDRATLQALLFYTPDSLPLNFDTTGVPPPPPGPNITSEHIVNLFMVANSQLFTRYLPPMQTSWPYHPLLCYRKAFDKKMCNGRALDFFTFILENKVLKPLRSKNR
jgi:filamentous hemagglutinin family protein